MESVGVFLEEEHEFSLSKILSTEEADFVANLLCHDKLYISFGFGNSSNFRPIDEHDENTSVLLMLSALILNGSDDEETNAGENGQSLEDDCIASKELNGGAISDSTGLIPGTSFICSY